MASLGVIRILCLMFTDSEISDDIRHEAILLGIALLLGGNLKC